MNTDQLILIAGNHLVPKRVRDLACDVLAKQLTVDLEQYKDNQEAEVPTDGRKNPEYMVYLDDCAYRMVKPHAYVVWLDIKKRESAKPEEEPAKAEFQFIPGESEFRMVDRLQAIADRKYQPIIEELDRQLGEATKAAVHNGKLASKRFTQIEDLQTELNEAREIANARLEELRQCQMERDECNNAAGRLQTELKAVKAERDQLKKVEEVIKAFMLTISNLPASEIVVGGDLIHHARSYRLTLTEFTDADRKRLRLEKP